MLETVQHVFGLLLRLILNYLYIDIAFYKLMIFCEWILDQLGLFHKNFD